MDINTLKEKLVNEVQLDMDNPECNLTFLQAFDISFYHYVDIYDIRISQRLYEECLKHVRNEVKSF